jgi:hypothetical protein
MGDKPPPQLLLAVLQQPLLAQPPYDGGPYVYYRARLAKIGPGTFVSEWSTITG